LPPPVSLPLARTSGSTTPGAGLDQLLLGVVEDHRAPPHTSASATRPRRAGSAGAGLIARTPPPPMRWPLGREAPGGPRSRHWRSGRLQVAGSCWRRASKIRQRAQVPAGVEVATAGREVSTPPRCTQHVRTDPGAFRCRVDAEPGPVALGRDEGPIDGRCRPDSARRGRSRRPWRPHRPVSARLARESRRGSAQSDGVLYDLGAVLRTVPSGRLHRFELGVLLGRAWGCIGARSPPLSRPSGTRSGAFGLPSERCLGSARFPAG